MTGGIIYCETCKGRGTEKGCPKCGAVQINPKKKDKK